MSLSLGNLNDGDNLYDLKTPLYFSSRKENDEVVRPQLTLRPKEYAQLTVAHNACTVLASKPGRRVEKRPGEYCLRAQQFILS